MKKKTTVILLLLVILLVAVGIYLAKPHDTTLRILFTCDTHGRLEPCGCFEGQMGGLTRVDTLLQQQGTTSDIRVDVGDSIGGSEDYHILHYRYMLQAFELMGFHALNIGAREAQLTAAQLSELSQTSPVPFVSANVLDANTRQPLFPPYRIISRGGQQIAIVGVLDPQTSPSGFGEGVEVEDLYASLHRLIPILKKKAGVIILLAFTDELTLADLARQFYEADIILGGDVSQPSQELTQVNRSVILYVTNEARSLGRMDVVIKSRGHLEIEEQDVMLVHDKIPEAERIIALAKAYRQEIRDAVLAVDKKDYRQEGIIPGIRAPASYTGTQSCIPCHKSAAQTWKRTGHSYAFKALVRRGADADPNCIGCHTIGFGRADGYRREFGDQKLINVGCEGCHGPGSLHIRRYKDKVENDFKFRPIGAGDCRTCHHGEFSRPFNWKLFWHHIRH